MPSEILREQISHWCEPAVIFETLYGDAERAFWIDRGIAAASGTSFMGIAGEPLVDSARLGLLDAAAARLAANGDSRIAAPEGAMPVPLGWVGYLGYDAFGAAGEPTDDSALRYPPFALAWADRVIAFDHSSRSIELIAIDDDQDGEFSARQWITRTAERIAAQARQATQALQTTQDRTQAAERAAIPTAGTPMVDSAVSGRAAAPIAGPIAPVEWADSDEEYLAKVRECLRYIRDGDAYQLCLTTRVSVATHPLPLPTYLRLRQSSPTHHGAFFRFGDLTLLSASPELFLLVDPNGVVETRPIKGTRRRGATEEEDRALAEELAASDKERAENLMIVDLMRNDLTRVCDPASVTVTSLLAVETYAHVHQLVSRVRGRLSPGRTGLDAVAACFPAGSMTGAPRERAMELLVHLEGRPREIYAGAFGWLGIDGSVDLAMVIRSIVLDPQGATIGTGGGITSSSDPVEELAEAKLKARALLAVLGR